MKSTAEAKDTIKIAYMEKEYLINLKILIFLLSKLENKEIKYMNKKEIIAHMDKYGLSKDEDFLETISKFEN